MMHSKTKSAKEGALQKLIQMLDAKDADGLRGLKKPAVAAIEVHKEPDGDEDDEGMAPGFKEHWEKACGGGKMAFGGKVPKNDVGHDDEGPMDEVEDPMPDMMDAGDDTKDVLSDDEKERIRMLYHKHCIQ